MIFSFLNIYILLALISGILMRYEKNILGCGLVGFYPKKNKKVDLSKLYALWMINEERGTHSCGISYGQERIVGINTKAKATSLIKDIYKDMMTKDLINKPIICHTRHATSGVHNDYNSHPFMWFRKVETNYFMFAHNGVIKNLYDLKKTLGMSRHKEDMMVIDSHVLGLAMYDSFVNLLSEEEILTQYEGNAAFICYNSDNIFKVWKGANNNIEERPLHYVETKDGWYFCSIDTSLQNIFLTEPISVENNTLITFKNHKLVDSKVYDRKLKVSETPIISNSYKSATTFNELLSRSHDKKDLEKDFTLDIVKNALKLVLKNVITPIEKINIEQSLTKNLIVVATYGLQKGKYINKEMNRVVEGLVNISEVSKHLMITKTGGKEFNFQSGVLINKSHSYKDLLTLFQYGLQLDMTYEDIFNNMHSHIKPAIVDFIPLYDEKQILKMIVYKNKLNSNLDYITAHDTITTTIPTHFSFMLQAYGIGNALYLNILNDTKTK